MCVCVRYTNLKTEISFIILMMMMVVGGADDAVISFIVVMRVSETYIAKTLYSYENISKKNIK